MSSVQSQRSGYQSSSSLSPVTVAGVVIVHLGLGAAILGMTAIKVFVPTPEPIWVTLERAEKPKEDPTPTRPTEAKVDRPVTDTKPTIVLPPPPDTGTFAKPDPFPELTGGGGNGGIGSGPGDVLKPVEPPVPVLVEARPDARYRDDFQPPYPAAMLRMQMEGNVTVRLTIGTNGRVLDVALVSAADPAFFEATRKQALGRWRFVPATRDGVAITSERVMTVRFRLTE